MTRIFPANSNEVTQRADPAANSPTKTIADGCPLTTGRTRITDLRKGVTDRPLRPYVAGILSHFSKFIYFLTWARHKVFHMIRLFLFLEAQLSAFKVVFFLLGNHEAYGSSYAASKASLQVFYEHCQQQRAADPDLGEFVVLDQTRYDVNDQVTVLGCTLYSHVLPEQERDVSMRVNDFYEIKQWSVGDHNAAHRSNVEWLKRELAVLSEKEPSRRVIVLSHHSPTMISDPRYRNTPLTSVFSTDFVLRQFDGSQICVWAFGHTHYNSDFTAGGVRLFSNQRGYVHSLWVGFDVRKVVSL